MTENEWLACTDPTLLLKFLREKASDRKQRLLAVACCRNIQYSLTDPRSVDALEVAERFADGMASEAERESAETAATAATQNLYPSGKDWAAQAVANATFQISPNTLIADAVAFYAVEAALFTAAETADEDNDPTRGPTWASERAWQVDVLRCIFGNPFHSIILDPAWLTWHDGLLVLMSQKMYDNRDFADMPVLADALEEAGCTDQDILVHCRSGGEHVRGCWLIDALLGKK